MKSLQTSLNIACSVYNPSNFMSYFTPSLQVFLPLPTHLTPATPHISHLTGDHGCHDEVSSFFFKNCSNIFHAACYVILFLFVLFQFSMTISEVGGEGGWGWLVATASFFIHAIIGGIGYSCGVWQMIFSEYFGKNHYQTAWLSSVLLGMTVLGGIMFTWWICTLKLKKVLHNCI